MLLKNFPRLIALSFIMLIQSCSSIRTPSIYHSENSTNFDKASFKNYKASCAIKITAKNFEQAARCEILIRGDEMNFKFFVPLQGLVGTVHVKDDNLTLRDHFNKKDYFYATDDSRLEEFLGINTQNFKALIYGAVELNDGYFEIQWIDKRPAVWQASSNDTKVDLSNWENIDNRLWPKFFLLKNVKKSTTLQLNIRSISFPNNLNFKAR